MTPIPIHPVTEGCPQDDPLPVESTFEDKPAAFDAPELDLLRDLLIGHYREQINALEARVVALETQTSDQDALIDTLTPVLGDLIRNNIRDNRDEMIEALYPIIGGLVIRAVSEAIQDLARNVDARMRRSFDIGFLWRQLKAQMGGVSQGEAILRSALPFAVSEVFLIHLESGLPIWYASSRPDELSDDSDIISSMLTAIRDFVADAFGRGQTGDLERIQYGDRQILIERTTHVYAAVVFHGIEPSGYRERLRRDLIAIEYQHGRQLRRYNGDSSTLNAAVSKHLRPLLSVYRPEQEVIFDRAEKFWLFGGVAAVLIMLVIAGWFWFLSY